MATLTVQRTNRATGLQPTYAAATVSGDNAPNDGRSFIHLKNTGTQKTITVALARLTDGQLPAPKTYTLLATTGDLMIGPYSPVDYNNRTDGLLHITYSPDATGVTVAAIGLGD